MKIKPMFFSLHQPQPVSKNQMSANWGHCNTIMGHVNDAMQIRIAKSQRVFA